jgi:lipopolysaccharide heptosyltransferase II
MYTKFFTPEQQSEQAILQDDLQHILVMRPDGIGEVIMLSPALRTLKEALPNAEITLITSPTGSQAAPLLPWINDVMVYPDLWKDITEASLLNLRKDMAFIEQLREQQFSTAMVFTNTSQSPWPAAYACYLAGVPYRVGFSGDLRSSALSHFLPPPADDLHQIDRNLHLLEAIGIYEASNHLELHIPQDMENRAKELLIENGVKQGTPYIVLAPGASVPAYQYAPHHFAAAARILAAQTDLHIVIVGSYEDVEAIQPLLQVANENLYGNVHSLVGKTTIPELAVIIRQASLTITNRSAAMHIADVFQRPLLVLCPETDDTSSWMPRHASARVLCRPASCSLCSESDCRYWMKCLDIRPEEVAIAAMEMLGEQAYSPATYHVLQEYGSEMSET